MGQIKASLTLPKNSYKYKETLYFIMEIDCSKLSIDVSGVNISLNVHLKTIGNTQTGKNDNNNNNLKSIEIAKKKIQSKVFIISFNFISD